MLTVKANVRKFKLSFLPLEINNNTLFVNGRYITVPFKNGISISYPNTLVFSREDGLWINHSESRVIAECKEGSAIVPGFDAVKFRILEREKISIPIIENGGNVNFLKVVLDKNHNYLKNRDTVYVRWYAPNDELPEKICPDDYVNYNGYFLYKMHSVSNGRYDFSTAELDNYKTKVRFYLNDGIREVGVLVPVEGGAKDIENTLFIYGDDNLINELATNMSIDTFYGDDERFFVKTAEYLVDGEKRYDAVLTPNTEILLRLGDPRIELPLIQDFDPSIMQDEEISQFVTNESSKAINPIIDYEKQQFIPVFGEKDVEKLLFRIHLRQHDEDWNTNDNLGWIGYPDRDKDGNSVMFMGFDNDDIYYQKKRVSETFLRVSFYTSETKNGSENETTTDRRRQKLLYTAKIFLNSANLYGKYIDNVASDEVVEFDDVLELCKDAKTGTEGVYSVSGCPLSTIYTEFACTQKYDYANSTEGFYLHLFPGNLNTDGEGVIYVKFELNNAKYGKSIPLVLFKDGFRKGYMVKDENDGYYVDMEALNDDIYTKVLIRKNEEKGRYEWEFYDDDEEYGFIDFGADGDNTLTLQLVEPRINEEYGKGSKRKKREKESSEEEYIVNTEVPATPEQEPEVNPEPDPNPRPTPSPTPTGKIFDAYFHHYSLKRLEGTVIDREYSSDNAGWTPTVENTKYPYVTAKFSTEPEGLYFAYKLTGWGSFDSASMHSSVKITEEKKGMSTSMLVNKTNDIHYYYIDYVAPNNEETKRLTVKQWPIQYYIAIGSNPTRVDYGQSTKRVTLTTGTKIENLTITTKDGDFFSFTPEFHQTQTKFDTQELYIYYINLNISENENRSQRSGSIKFAINEERYAVLDVVQSGNTNAGQDIDDEDYVYSIEKTVSPTYISEIKEGRKTVFTFTETLYKRNKNTGVVEQSNDWVQYGVGPVKYTEQSIFNSYGKQYFTMFSDDSTNNSTITFTLNVDELKYTDTELPYCLIGIVNGKVVASGGFNVDYCTKLLKHTPVAYLFNENDIVFNEENSTLTFNLTKSVSMARDVYFAEDGTDYESEFTFSKPIGGSFGLEPGRYYAIYGTIYAVDHYIENSIKLTTQGRELSINNDANTPWKYSSVGNNIYVVENTGSRKYHLWDESVTPSTKWIAISEPITLERGTCNIKISYTVDTRDESGTCGGEQQPETYNVDFIGSLDKVQDTPQTETYDVDFIGSLDKEEETPQTETYDVDFIGSLDKEEDAPSEIYTYTIHFAHEEDLPTAYFYWYKDERLSQPFEDADEDSNTFTTSAEELWVTPHSSIRNSTINPSCVHLTKYNTEATVDVVVRYRLFVYPSWARYPNIKWSKDEAGTQVISEGTATDIYTSERPVWAYITYEDCTPQNVQLTLNEQQKSVWLEKSEYTFTVNLFPEEARSTAVYKWYEEEEKWHPIRTADGNTVTYDEPNLYCVVSADGYVGTEFWISFYDDGLTKDVTLEEVPVEITVTPMIGEIGGEDTAFVLAVSNNKNREMKHSVSVVNTNSLSTLPTDQDFKICSNQINIGNGNAIFVILRHGYSGGYLNTTTGRFTISTEGYDDIQRTLTASAGSEHAARARKVLGGGYGVFTTVRLMPYTTQNVNILVDLIGVLTGAAEIEGNVKRSYDNNIYAEEVTTVATTYTCSNGPQDLMFDSAEMLPTNLMSLTLGIKYSTFRFTILPNNTDRIRLGFASVFADVTGTRPGSDIASRHIYIDTVMQESENLRFVLNENALTGSYPGTFLYRTESKILEVIDLSKHGTVYEIPIDNTDDDYRIWVLSDIRNNISVTSLNGQATTTLVSDGCVRYGFTTNTTKDGDYYHDGFRIEIL